MANQWFRMYAEFAHDPKVQMLSETDQRRYVMLLCIRCNGDVTLQDSEVAFQLRISNEEWVATKGILVDKNLVTEDNKPTAWDKRQFASDSSAARVAKHRAKAKEACNVTVTPQIQNRTDTEKTTPLVDSKLPTCPQQEIIKLYAKHLPTLPQPRVWEGARAKNLQARWRWVIEDLGKRGKPNSPGDALDFFDRMFAYVAGSDFLTGRTGAWTGCDLAWICNAENFAKIIEGKYENKEAA